MLLVIGSFITSFVISILNAGQYTKAETAIREGLKAFSLCITISICIACVTLGISYDRYIGLKQHQANFENYAQAINEYTKKASGLEKTGEITDLKYQSYQTSLKDLIEDFREYCTKYNKSVVGKRILGNNAIFNWLIIMPDEDMQVVQVSDFLD